MAPIYEYRCKDCFQCFEEITCVYEERDRRHVLCPECDSYAIEQLPSYFGGYQIRGDNSASQTPKKFRKERD